MNIALKNIQVTNMSTRIELWNGWYFYNNMIYDGAGNRYSENDIRMSWLAGELVRENLSNPSNIKIMHKELRKKKIQATHLPTICLVWDSPKEGIIESVYQLKE